MRCPRCGNENPDANRFCGMCGTTLLQPSVTAAAAVGQNQAQAPVARSAAESVAAAAPAPTALKTTPAAHSDVPVISGPSFLGLNQPASTQSTRKRPSLSIDPHNAPSTGSLDYLLEDEEEPRGGGGWKFVLIIVALALAVGLGYLRWKHQGLGWISSGTKSAPAATQTSEAPDASTPAPSSSGAASASPPSANPTAAAGSQPAPADPTATPASPASGSASPLPAGPSSGAPASAVPAPSGSTASSPATPASTPAISAAGDAAKSDSPPAAAVQPTAAKDSSPATSDAPPEATPEKPEDVPVKRSAKPAAPVRPAKPDPVAEAQKYLYGRGARQDCERGIRLLKPVANQANPKAMIEMGALYSAGLCTPRDLPTAYRWFALALRKDPDNQAVQTDLQKLWGEMTQPERQLAIRLSQ